MGLFGFNTLYHKNSFNFLFCEFKKKEKKKKERKTTAVEIALWWGIWFWLKLNEQKTVPDMLRDGGRDIRLHD